jgi:hypothetical protein
MNDSQNCIDRIRIRRLPYPPATSLRIPLSPEISSSQRPSSVLALYFHVSIGIDGLRCDKIDVKLDLAILVLTHKSVVPILQKLHESGLRRIDTDGDIPDFDYYRRSDNIDDRLWQGQSKSSDVYL